MPLTSRSSSGKLRRSSQGVTCRCQCALKVYLHREELPDGDYHCDGVFREEWPSGNSRVMDVFGSRLKGLRGSSTKRAFAARLGVSPSNYQYYEEGRVPEPERLSAMANTLGVSIDFLLGRTDDPSLRTTPPQARGDVATVGTPVWLHQSRSAPGGVDQSRMDSAPKPGPYEEESSVKPAPPGSRGDFAAAQMPARPLDRSSSVRGVAQNMTVPSRRDGIAAGHNTAEKESDSLGTAKSASQVSLHGTPGSGKTSLALEMALRAAKDASVEKPESPDMSTRSPDKPVSQSMSLPLRDEGMESDIPAKKNAFVEKPGSSDMEHAAVRSEPAPGEENNDRDRRIERSLRTLDERVARIERLFLAFLDKRAAPDPPARSPIHAGQGDKLFEQVMDLLGLHGQEHVLRFWPQLTKGERDALVGQILSVDFALVEKMKGLLKTNPVPRSLGEAEPAPVVLRDADMQAPNEAEGERALQAGKVAVVLAAGGTGSRLGFFAAKGACPIGPVSGATLFELHCRKVAALEQQYRTCVPLYVVTNRETQTSIRAFFMEHSYFGLSPERIFFVEQAMWPNMDANGRLILSLPAGLSMNPGGEGGILSDLAKSGALDTMATHGIETVFYCRVDNPLVNIDPFFLGVHRTRKADVSLKVFERRDPGEGLGVLTKCGARYAILHYTELTADQRYARTGDGALRLRYGNAGTYAFSLDFLQRQAIEGLPIHVVFGRVPYCDEQGRHVNPATKNAFKFESLMSDVVLKSDRVVPVVCDRADEFSPVKNQEGEASPHTAQRDLVNKYARMLEAAGVAVPRTQAGDPTWRIEIDPVYALNAEDLRRRLPPDFSIKGHTFLGPDTRAMSPDVPPEVGPAG